MKTKIYIIIYLLSTSSLLSMSNNWKLTLINGDTISNISLQRLEGDSLVISDTTFTKCILVDSIIEVRQINKSYFREGAGIGLLGGVIIGVLIGSAAYKESGPSSGESKDSINLDFMPGGPGINTLAGGILGGLSGFLVGGIIGAFSRKDEIYDLLLKNHDQKMNMIKLILLNE